MKLGFLTACLPTWSLDDVARCASRTGFEALEVAAWPDLGDRPFTATHLRAEAFGPAQADEVCALFDRHGLTLSSLAYYDNNLHSDPNERQAVNDQLRACIKAAALVGAPTVGTFIDRDPGKTITDNLRDAEKIFPPLV